jgi:hypothetical protein
VAWRLLSTLSRAFNTTPITGTATFSNANTTAVTSTAVTTLVANQSLVGKKAFGMKIAAVSGLGNYGIIGISRATGTSAGIGFDGSNSYGAYSNGSNFPSGGNGMTWTLGTDLAAVCDQGASLIWFTSDGTNFYGTATVNAAAVAAGTSGIDISAMTAATIYPCAGSFSNAGWGFTYEAYPYSLPSGYTSM